MARTKAQELTTEEKLKLLFDLQQIHIKIAEIETLRGELPMEVKDLEDELEGLNKRIAILEDEMGQLDDAISKNENAKEDANAMIEKYGKQQMDVKNNREYDALTKEIELQNLNIQLADKKINDATAAKEGKQAYLDESNEFLAQRQGDLEAKKDELEKIMADTAKEEETLQNKVTKQSGKIEDRLLNAYNRVRTTFRNGLAVVSIEREACGGCFAKIPPQRQLEIRQRKRIITCEHCGRIVVDFEVDGK